MSLYLPFDNCGPAPFPCPPFGGPCPPPCGPCGPCLPVPPPFKCQPNVLPQNGNNAWEVFQVPNSAVNPYVSTGPFYDDYKYNIINSSVVTVTFAVGGGVTIVVNTQAVKIPVKTINIVVSVLQVDGNVYLMQYTATQATNNTVGQYSVLVPNVPNLPANGGVATISINYTC